MPQRAAQGRPGGTSTRPTQRPARRTPSARARFATAGAGQRRRQPRSATTERGRAGRSNRGARLDTSQVNDRRGRRGGAAGAGGGGLGLLGLLLVTALDAPGGGDPTTAAGRGAVADGGSAASRRTGADADERQDCRLVALVNSVRCDTFAPDALGGPDPGAGA